MAKPTDNSEVFLDQLISSIQTHLPTIKGTYFTVSLYPPLMTPGPGVVPFIGYTIPPASRGVSGGSTDNLQSTPEEQALEQKRIEEAITLTPEQELLAEDATEKGYGINESTATGLSGEAQSSPASRNNSESNGSESNNIEDSNAANAANSEKIEECGNIKLKEPPQVVIDAMRKWGIKTPLQKAHFLAQCAHESGNFIYTKEIWGPSSAQQRYEGRKDLGNVQPGDGFRFAGRGYIQVTGRANYTQFKKGVTDDVVANSTLVEKKYVAETACWFWRTRKLNEAAVDDSMGTLKYITKRINGGYNGLDDRKKKFCGYWKKLKENPNLYS
jgi:putative chitinase